MTHVYLWLVDQGLWKSVITWSVGVILGALVTWRPWNRHRRAQDRIIDLLRADTPGGIEALLVAVKALQGVTEKSEGEDQGKTP